MSRRAYSALSQLKLAIVSRVNHELRTPLTVATMAFELLRAESGDAAAEAKHREMLGRALLRLREHLDNLHVLEPGFAAAGRREDGDLLDVLAASIDEFGEPARRRGIGLSLRVAGAPRRFAVDAPLLGLAVRNLLDNAVRFNRPGGRVDVSVELEGGRARIVVEDDGAGMTPAHLRRALAGFHQEEHFLTRREGGLGIGLAAARRAIEACGGTLLASSRTRSGSIFTIHMPEASL